MSKQISEFNDRNLKKELRSCEFRCKILRTRIKRGQIKKLDELVKLDFRIRDIQKEMKWRRRDAAKI